MSTTQLNDPSVLLCLECLSGQVTYACPNIFCITTKSGVAIFSGPVNVLALHQAGIATIRLLDRYYIAYDMTDNRTRAKPELVLFDLLANHYEDDIDLTNNLQVIRKLLSLVTHGVRSGRILDYGCGTGLSSRVAAEFGVQIVGFDRSRAMLAIARRHGTMTLTSKQLDTLREASLDGMIASYALHLAAALEDLPRAARKLRLNARLAANFHKGMGMYETEEILLQLGFVPDRLTRSLTAKHIASWIRVEP